MKEKKPNRYALKMLALILFGMGGVFFLLYLIKLALSQDNWILGFLTGLAAILFAPLVNTITGIFDDSVEISAVSFWRNYWKVLVSLVFSLLFILFIFPFIALILGAVLGGMMILVILAGYFIYLLQEVMGINVGASTDIGLWDLTKYFFALISYEALFFIGYYIYSKNEEKTWNKLRSIFAR